MSWKPDADQITFVDLASHDSFVHSENLDAFLETEVGQAQLESMMEEMNQQAQMYDQDDYEATVQEARRMLFSEQASQSFGSSQPEMTDQQMIEKMDGFDFFEFVGEVVDQIGDLANEITGKGVDAAVDGVENNDGLLGGAADALKNRDEQLQQQMKSINP